MVEAGCADENIEPVMEDCGCVCWESAVPNIDVAGCAADAPPNTDVFPPPKGALDGSDPKPDAGCPNPDEGGSALPKAEDEVGVVPKDAVAAGANMPGDPYPGAFLPR